MLLYRLLRQDEVKTHLDSIIAKKEDSKVEVQQHVLFGYCLSKFISTTKDKEALFEFAANNRKNQKNVGLLLLACNQSVAIIDTERLPNGCEIIDLTDDKIVENNLTNKKAKNYAMKFKEVLLVGEIPASSFRVTTVENLKKESYFQTGSGFQSADFSSARITGAAYFILVVIPVLLVIIITYIASYYWQGNRIFSQSAQRQFLSQHLGSTYIY